jgi:AMMECR1 domain-containing protein
MHKIARTILESYIFEKKILSQKDLQISAPIYREKIPVFVTIYDGESVIGSIGRIYPSHETLIEELIENTLLITKDPRFEPYTHNPEMARKLQYRVDIFHDTDRRLIHHPDDLDSSSEGIIVLCQKQGKVGIILPHMLSPSLSGEEFYHHAIQKIDIDIKKLGK